MIYAIGDIHGQITMLGKMLDLLRDLPLKNEDTVLFLGDYIDRGENSCAVIDLLLEFEKEHSDCIFLRGNHEQMMLDARSSALPEVSEDGQYAVFSEPTLIWLQNGGMDALDSYGEIQNPLCWWDHIPENHWDFVRNTQLEYITPRYHFVHAGLVPTGSLWIEGQTYGLEPRLWIREPFLSSRASFNGRIVVFGHTPQMRGRPLIHRNKIGLDTGAVFGGPLTMAAFDPDVAPRRIPNPPIYQISP